MVVLYLSKYITASYQKENNCYNILICVYRPKWFIRLNESEKKLIHILIITLLTKLLTTRSV